MATKIKNPVLRVKNFGPFGENPDRFYEDGTPTNGFFKVEFSPVTVFIGPQASGKSTLLKLYAGFAFLEKYVYKETVLGERFDLTEVLNEIPIFSNAGLEEYFTDKAKVEYEGYIYSFTTDFSKDARKVKGLNALYSPIISHKIISKNLDNYERPKIMYVPAERNREGLKNPSVLIRLFFDRYIDACEKFAGEKIDLPVKSFRFFYQDYVKRIFAENETSVRIENAASGLQSIAPLSITSKFLSEKIHSSFSENIKTCDDPNLFPNIKNAVEKWLVKNYDTIMLDAAFTYIGQAINELENVRKGKVIDKEIYEAIKGAVHNHFNSCFINIVEEPEQNLFPETQAAVLYELLGYKNANPHNKLIFSTHSPYVLCALNNAILADTVFQKTGKEVAKFPEEKRISFDEISAYKCENGGIVSIKNEETGLIDADAIDECSSKINSDFDELLEMLPENEMQESGAHEWQN